MGETKNWKTKHMTMLTTLTMTMLARLLCRSRTLSAYAVLESVCGYITYVHTYIWKRRWIHPISYKTRQTRYVGTKWKIEIICSNAGIGWCLHSLQRGWSWCLEHFENCNWASVPGLIKVNRAIMRTHELILFSSSANLNLLFCIFLPHHYNDASHYNSHSKSHLAMYNIDSKTFSALSLWPLIKLLSYNRKDFFLFEYVHFQAVLFLLMAKRRENLHIVLLLVYLVIRMYGM